MAMAKADVFNLALRHLQIPNETISDPDDTDDALAVIFSALWEVHLPKELELHDWQFARAMVTLSDATGAYPDTPYEGLTYIYYWPADCLAPRFINGNTRADNVPWKIGLQGLAGSRSRLIYTSRESAQLVYTRNVVQDYAHFSYAFDAMIAARLALEYGMFKLGGGTRVKGLKDLYTAMVIEARQHDAQLINDENWQDMETTRYVASRESSLNPSMSTLLGDY